VFRADLDPRVATLALLGLGNAAALWFDDEPGMTLERIARHYADLLARGLRADQLPRPRTSAKSFLQPNPSHENAHRSAHPPIRARRDR